MGSTPASRDRAGLARFQRCWCFKKGLESHGTCSVSPSGLAKEGYLALVPDLYSRDEARRELTEEEVIEALPLARAPERDALILALPREKQASARRVVEWFLARDTSTYLPDALLSVAYLQRHELVRADAIATLGFSLGAGLSLSIAASGEPLAGGVVFYGSPPPFEQIPNIRYPSL